MRLLWISLLLLGSIRAADVPKEEQLRLAGSVRVIFERKCNECHGSQLKKPEGKFGYVLDLRRLAENEDFIVRGKPGESDLFRMVRDEEMPPDDHPATPPLMAQEKDLVRRWILAGAPAALPAVLPNLPGGKPAAAVAPAPTGGARERAMKAAVTLDAKRMPAAEIVREIARQSGIPVTYVEPAKEPILSVRLRNGTAFEALNYLALCGNFSLTFTADAAVIGPNPPPVPAGAPKAGASAAVTPAHFAR